MNREISEDEAEDSRELSFANDNAFETKIPKERERERVCVSVGESTRDREQVLESVRDCACVSA